jgi:hypothetical protein
LFYHENNKEKFWELVLKYLSDVELVNNEPYLVIDTQGELSELFCDNRRNDLSPETVSEILDGEYGNDYFYSSYDLTDNIYRNVIEDLTEENLSYLKNYILKVLDGEQIVPHTELLEKYAEEQGHPEYVIIDGSNINQIVDDEETMMKLLSNELEELKSELYSVYSSAYNNAYEEELYEDIWNELSTYFGKGEWVSRPHTYKKDTEVQKFRTPINNFESYILDYLSENSAYSDGTLEYWGSYLSVLKNGTECLSVYPSDYADSSKVTKLVNEFIRDYL